MAYSVTDDAPLVRKRPGYWRRYAVWHAVGGMLLFAGFVVMVEGLR